MGSVIFILFILLPISGLPFDPQVNSSPTITWDSHFCLGCHDGTIGPNITNMGWNLFKGETPPNFCVKQGHPVGIDYRLAQLGSRGRLKASSLLDTAINLENGQVGCTSCHNANSQLRAKLVMDNAGSRLCFSCHNL